MARSKSRIARFLLYGLLCAVISAIFASELPEQLTLTSDTSNDYTLRSPSLPKSIQPLSSVGQGAPFFITCALAVPSWQFWSAVLGNASFHNRSLFLIHSVLRL